MANLEVQQQVLEPEVVLLPEFWSSGPSAKINPADGDSVCFEKIGSLWKTFYSEVSTIPDQIEPRRIFGVYTNYASDHRGEYQLSAACAVKPLPNKSEKLLTLHVPTQRYLCFKTFGEQPEIVIQTWSRIWDYFADSAEHRRAFTTDFEDYISSNAVAIYIAII